MGVCEHTLLVCENGGLTQINLPASFAHDTRRHGCNWAEPLIWVKPENPPRAVMEARIASAIRGTGFVRKNPS